MAGRRILVGVVGRPHGVRGLVRVASHTADPASLAAYGPLEDDQGRRFTVAWRGEGIAQLALLTAGRPVPVVDRTAAQKLTNTRLYLERDRLPPPDEEEFYIADLIGLSVLDRRGEWLGTVAAVHDYGAGASIEVAREGAPPLLVPFTRASVPDLDLAAGTLVAIPPEEVAGERGGKRAA